MSARRFTARPQSAPGDFYVVNNECVSCGAPHAVAPDLIGWAEDVEPSHCTWKRQPATQQETDQAIDAVLASEVACHRYAGSDPRIRSSDNASSSNFTLVVDNPSGIDRFLITLRRIFRS